MKTDPRHDGQPDLLDVILADDEWTAASERSRRAALLEMRRAKWHQRAQTLLRCAAVLAVLAVGVSTMLLNGDLSDVDGQPSTGNRLKHVEAAQIGDEELLAMLPEGSAVVAQVNGETVLVFLDPEIEAQFVR